MSGILEADLGLLIDRYYEAAARPELWRTALAETAHILGAEGVELFPGPNTLFAPIYSESLDEVVAAGVAQGWFSDNPRVKRGVPLLLRDHDLITEATIFAPEELDRLPFNAEFAGRFGLRWFAAAYLSSGGPPNILFSVERRADQEPFSRREQAMLRLLLPHLRRSAQLAVSLADAQAHGRLDALDDLHCGGLLVGPGGSVLRLNARAERCLGPGLVLRAGRLSATQADANEALQAMILAATQRGSAHAAPALGPVAIPRPGSAPLVVHASPVVGRAQDLFHRARAILLILDPEARQEPDARLLRQLFRLTGEEARLARAIAQGRTIKEAAADLGKTEGTLRFQLRSIFAKTNTTRQSELVSLLVRLEALGTR